MALLTLSYIFRIGFRYYLEAKEKDRIDYEAYSLPRREKTQKYPLYDQDLTERMNRRVRRGFCAGRQK